MHMDECDAVLFTELRSTKEFVVSYSSGNEEFKILAKRMLTRSNAGTFYEIFDE